MKPSEIRCGKTYCNKSGRVERRIVGLTTVGDYNKSHYRPYFHLGAGVLSQDAMLIGYVDKKHTEPVFTPLLSFSAWAKREV